MPCLQVRVVGLSFVELFGLWTASMAPAAHPPSLDLHKALRSGHVDATWGYPPQAKIDAFKVQLGKNVVMAAPGNIRNSGVTFNVAKTPVANQRVREALSLALTRVDMAKILAPIAPLDTVGDMLHPGSNWGVSHRERYVFPGVGKDHAANPRKAERWLAAAGYPDSFQTVLTKRNLKTPYIDFGGYLISAWQKAAVEATSSSPFPLA